MATLDPALTADIDCHLGDPDPEDLPGQAKGYRVLLNGHTNMDGALLRHLSPELEKIIFLGTGASSYIDLKAADENGIEIVTIANYGDRSVAEHAFALLMAAVRDVARMDREMRQGHWVRSKGMELKGKTIGIAGFGGIGRELAEIC
ncbi:MAG: NAD(P)-dependent oxidoreductase, partial [Pseudomonadota bacterium]